MNDSELYNTYCDFMNYQISYSTLTHGGKNNAPKIK
jgi:hypothetical protein